MAPDREGRAAEWLDTRHRRRGSRRWMLAITLAVLVVITGVVVVDHRSAGSTSPPPTSAPLPATDQPTASSDDGSADSGATPTGAGSPDSATPSTAAAVVTSTGHELFATDSSWELVAYGSGSVVRVQPARGRIIRTRAAAGPGPATLAVGADFVIVRPWDGSGLLVEDDHPARPLGGYLATAQTVGSGPDPAHVWAGTGPQVNSSGEQVRIRLVDQAGRFGGRELSVPTGTAGYWGASDGRGGLVVAGAGGSYLATLDGLRLITSGDLLAIGPTGFLSTECDARQACRAVVTDRAGRRRDLGAVGDQQAVAVGTISPDGHRAAILLRGAGGPVAVLVDLRTGTRQALDLPSATYGPQTQVWSPDSRYLLVTNQSRLFVVDAATSSVRPLPEVAVALSVLVVRSQ